MDMKEMRVTVELNNSEIWEIIFPLVDSLKRSAEHYINHFKGHTELEFIEYVKTNNKGKSDLLTSFTNIINRTDLINGFNYHCRSLYENTEIKK